MASICKDAGGRKRVLFVAEDGIRRTIRLGKATMEQARIFKGKLENLIIGRFTGIDTDTAVWVAALPDDMHRKLASFGLVKPRVVEPEPETEAEPPVCLGPFLEEYFRDRDDIKPASLIVYGHTRRNLLAYFGPEKPLRDVTEGDARGFVRDMKRGGLSKATIRKRTGNAKLFFNAALEAELIDKNPFRKLKGGSLANEERRRFISHEDMAKVIEACPDTEWRLIFALARYGGIRTPSETLALTWDDIEWDGGRLLVRSSKTEHFEGKESRVIPLFPELRPYLLAAFNEAEPGAVYCITRYRLDRCNLRTQAHRIIKRAGLQPWCRTFQNLRSSRETELTERFPLHVVTQWIGNSKAVAMKHYLQVTDDHFQQAIQAPTGAAHFAAQFGAESSRTDQQSTEGTEDPNGVLPADTAGCELVPVCAEATIGAGGIRTPVTFR